MSKKAKAIRKKVLLVEDDNTILVLLRLYLSRYGLDISEARDGMEGLCAARSTIPDLILTDLMMPNMNGFEMIKKIREDQNPKISKIPIVAVTSGSIEMQADCLDAGANSVLTKPINHNNLRQVVNLFLNK